jgi:hypothetical protein
MRIGGPYEAPATGVFRVRGVVMTRLPVIVLPRRVICCAVLSANRPRSLGQIPMTWHHIQVIDSADFCIYHALCLWESEGHSIGDGRVSWS